MIIGISKHFGRGGSGPVLDYLTGYLVNGETRSHKPEILRGDRNTVAAIIDALPFKRKYTSGVLSFHAEDHVTPEAQEDIMNRFEEAVFAGLETDRRSIIWIKHRDKGRTELHFLVPRVDLGTGKSLNIAPPTPASRDLIDTLRTAINLRYGFRDPTDPDYTQAVSLPGHVAKLAAQAKRLGRSAKADIRQVIAERVLDQARAGLIASRADVIAFLKAQGFNISREGINYVTIVRPETSERVRLKGEIFRKHFSPQDLNRSRHPHDPAKLVALERRLERLVAARANYHRARYGIKEQAVELSHKKEELAHDRTRNPFTQTGAKHRGSAGGSCKTICRDAFKLNDAAHHLCNASDGLECACQRLDKAHRTFARDFDAAVGNLGRRSRTETLVRRYGLADAVHRQERAFELELEL